MPRAVILPRSAFALFAVLSLVALRDPELVLTLAPAVLLLGLLSRGVRPGEKLIERLRGTTRRRAHARAASMPRPHLAVVIRPAGRQLAEALAMRPPPCVF
jgi:hypothetical protein